MTKDIRALVESYYQAQEMRKAIENRGRGCENEMVKNYIKKWKEDEKEIERYLEEWTDQDPVARWAKNIIGMGPVLAAALSAYIDIERAPTAGAIWKYAGITGTRRWFGRDGAQKLIPPRSRPTEADILRYADEYGHSPRHFLARLKGDLSRKNVIKELSKIPYNKDFRVICWRIAQCFKFNYKRQPDSYFGRVYQMRKADEVARNEAGEFADQAAAGARRVGESTHAYKFYKEGKLPPGHLDARAMRYTVKLFLACWHEVAYRERYGEDPPKPYPIAHLGHSKLIRAADVK